MKFGKHLQSQLVPEWKEAYMDYNYLKTLIDEIRRFKQINMSAASTPRGLQRRITFYRAFSGLTERYHHLKERSPRGGDVEDQVILVSPSRKEMSDEDDRYKTTFLMLNEEGGEYELVFFRRLDDEFNKVVKFYKEKVAAVMKEAALLNKQMDALIAFRIKVEDPEESIDWSMEMSRLRSDTSPNAGSSSNEGRQSMDIIQESDQGQEDNSEDIGYDSRGTSDTIPPDASSSDENIDETTRAARPAHLQILSRVKFNHTLEGPHSTIKGVLKCSDNHSLKFKKEELSRIEEKLKLALIVFYQKLRIVKSYSFLNLMAFSKIMKKYDKVASRNASKPYLKMVDNSYLGSSDEIHKVMERVEDTFIKHFANGDRSKGINMLRPKSKREMHRVTYSMGFFSGCTVSLVVALVLIARARGITGAEGGTTYMENMFPLYSLFAFIVLHMFMYAMDVYLWTRYRVNYQFIFGSKQGRGLGYREVLLLSTGLATLALASVLSNLDMQMDPKTKDYQALTELLPLGLVTLVLLIMLCPLNIIYRSSRWFLLTCAFHCVCAPLYKVTLPDFLLADQITSQVQAIRSLEFYICYYGWGDYKKRQNTCSDSTIYNIFNFIIVTIPYWWRFFQCIRRLYEEKDSMQGYNSLKYFSTIVAVCMRAAYSRNIDSLTWKWLAWTTSGIAAIASTYWDIVIDWGLLQRRSRNRWLRDKLLVPHKVVYFAAMILNILLRFAWLQTVLNFQVSFLHREALISVVASLEIIRRGIWNFFRLENEHLNNVGKYRAFKSVPLPFYYLEEEDKED